MPADGMYRKNKYHYPRGVCQTGVFQAQPLQVLGGSLLGTVGRQSIGISMQMRMFTLALSTAERMTDMKTSKIKFYLTSAVYFFIIIVAKSALFVLTMTNPPSCIAQTKSLENRCTIGVNGFTHAARRSTGAVCGDVSFGEKMV